MGDRMYYCTITLSGDAVLIIQYDMFLCHTYTISLLLNDPSLYKVCVLMSSTS
jgi:hypothetical protein